MDANDSIPDQFGFPSECLDFLVSANRHNTSLETAGGDPPAPQPSINCQQYIQDFYKEADFDVLKDKRFAAFVIVLYSVVITVGTIGNSLVVVTVARSRHMWNATNIFIANLALADIFVCVFDLPLSVYYQLTDSWIFGPALCHVIPPLFAVIVFASTLTLTMIAIDRFVLIVYPLRTRMSVKMALVLVVLIAVTSAAVASPISIYGDYEQVDDELLKIKRSYCVEKWPTTQRRRLYSVLTVVFQFFAPLIVIGILYFLIFWSVRSRMLSRGNRRTRTTKMLLAVVLVFAFTWTPFTLFALLSEFHIRVPGRYFKFVDVVMRGVAMSSSCFNPFLYAWMNDNFRSAFASILQRHPKHGMRCLHQCKDSDPTTKTDMPMTPMMRSRMARDRSSYFDERSNANDVTIPNYNASGKAAGENRNLLTVPGPPPLTMNGLVKDEIDNTNTLTKPLLNTRPLEGQC